jgi:hypothetical protein
MAPNLAEDVSSIGCPRKSFGGSSFGAAFGQVKIVAKPLLDLELVGVMTLKPCADC